MIRRDNHGKGRGATLGRAPHREKRNTTRPLAPSSFPGPPCIHHRSRKQLVAAHSVVFAVDQCCQRERVLNGQVNPRTVYICAPPLYCPHSILLHGTTSPSATHDTSFFRSKSIGTGKKERGVGGWGGTANRTTERKRNRAYNTRHRVHSGDTLDRDFPVCRRKSRSGFLSICLSFYAYQFYAQFAATSRTKTRLASDYHGCRRYSHRLTRITHEERQIEEQPEKSL